MHKVWKFPEIYILYIYSHFTINDVREPMFLPQTILSMGKLLPTRRASSKAIKQVN